MYPLHLSYRLTKDISKMVTAVKTMGVICIIMMFLVATTVGDDHEHKGDHHANKPETNDVVNVTTYAKVDGLKGAVDRNVPLVPNNN